MQRRMHSIMHRDTLPSLIRQISKLSFIFECFILMVAIFLFNVEEGGRRNERETSHGV
jgi:hypothetical protein